MSVRISVEVENQVAGYIVDHVIRRGFPPALRDIQTEFGFKSTSTARVVLARLVERGVVTVTPGIARGISVRDVAMVAPPEPM